MILLASIDRNVRRYTPTIRALMGPVFGALSVYSASANPELFDYVLDRQATARKAFDYSEMETRELFRGTLTRDGQTQTIDRDTSAWRLCQGANVRIESRVVYDEPYTVRDEPGVFRRHKGMSEAYLVRNDAYVASWGANNGKNVTDLNIYEHASADEMNQRAAMGFEYEGGFNILNYAYGLVTSGGSSPAEVRAQLNRMKTRGHFFAERKQIDGTEMIEIGYEWKGERILTALIDPNKGFMTTQLTYDEDSISSEGYRSRYAYTVEMWQLKPGVWVPEKLHCEFEMRSTRHGEQGTIDITIDSVKFGGPHPPELFMWESLRYPGGTAFRTDETGGGQVMRARGASLLTYARAGPESPKESAARKALHDVIIKMDITAAFTNPAAVLSAEQRPESGGATLENESAKDEANRSPLASLALLASTIAVIGVLVYTVRKNF